MDDDFNYLAEIGISLFRLNEYDWQELEETRHRGSRFSWTFPHAVARSAKKNSLALICITDDTGEAVGLRLCLVRSIQGVSTFDSRVLFDLVCPITPDSLDTLLEQLTETSLRSSAKRFSESKVVFEKVSPKLGKKLIELIFNIAENRSATQQIVWQLGSPSSNKNARALQLDAVKLALKAFGASEEAVELALPGDDTALAGVHLYEDAVIEHDARWIEGWNITVSEPTGRAVFERGSEKLEVFTANKRPLEELFGVDLIYLNRTRGSLVMVQYKMMEPGIRRVWKSASHEREEQEWTVRIDDQFKAELARMAKFDIDLDSAGPYRLSPSAFYFKLVKRDAEIKSPGLILSIGHLNHLMASGSLSGAKGGLRISYRELNGHYIRSSGFIELIRSGYIGTRGATTDHLEQLINVTLSEGRAVVAAIQTTTSDMEPVDETD